MGIGGYQGGLCYDLYGDYLMSFANSAAAGVVNMGVVAALLYQTTKRTRGAVLQPAFAT